MALGIPCLQPAHSIRGPSGETTNRLNDEPLLPSRALRTIGCPIGHAAGTRGGDDLRAGIGQWLPVPIPELLLDCQARAWPAPDRNKDSEFASRKRSVLLQLVLLGIVMSVTLALSDIPAGVWSKW